MVELSVCIVNLTSLAYIKDICFFLIQDDVKPLIAQGQIYFMLLGVAIVALKMIITKLIVFWKYFIKSSIG